MTRDVDEWADLMYRSGGHTTHIVPFGEDSSLCLIKRTDWYGTGDMDEIETALALPLCFICKAAADETPDEPVDIDWSQFEQEELT